VKNAINYQRKEYWGEKKKAIFLLYIKTEHWRNIGANYLATLYGWLSVNTMKDAFLIGALAKLTIFKDIPIVMFMAGIFLLGVLAEVGKMYMGYRIWRSGLIKTQNQWMQNHEINNPFNDKLKKQILELTKVVGEITGKEIPNHFNDE
jgi:hypothetical protein